MKNEEKDVHKSSQIKDKIPVQKQDKAEKKGFPGYPHYPASEDIYNNEKETDLNPEDPSKTKKPPVESNQRNEKDFPEDMTAEDLDVPGSKDDEAKANSGKEDEENNYYSLGGDNHNDLEEDNE
ncbi:hypothetical protein [Aequorivita capsosiphonis]|uniref:hypothetical protein n=1 Tax=Aequorivita capsosiphonis TaxID=487317 RepID=UPI0003F680E1|nr:hypothetical protein [Aequorivita capsosiphonis]